MFSDCAIPVVEPKHFLVILQSTTYICIYGQNGLRLKAERGK